MAASPTLDLPALERASGVPARTIRFYIAKGLVDRPRGAKRGAHYDQVHLRQLLQIRRWQEEGLSLDRIGELMAEDPQPVAPATKTARPGQVTLRTYVHIATGVALEINADRAGLTPEQLRSLVRALVHACDRELKGAENR